MTAPLPSGRTAPEPGHRCAYELWVDDQWISASSCHFGDTLPLDPPAPKRRAA